MLDTAASGRPSRQRGDEPPAGFPAAVLWDMDGTLVDTEPYWMAVEQELVETHGGEWTRAHAMQLVGCDLIVAAE